MSEEMKLDDLLRFTFKQKASDLHLSAGLPPMIRVDGDVKRINVPDLTSEGLRQMIYQIMTDDQVKNFEETLESDFSTEIKDRQMIKTQCGGCDNKDNREVESYPLICF